MASLPPMRTAMYQVKKNPQTWGRKRFFSDDVTFAHGGVKKEFPNMGTREFKILFLLSFDKMAICMSSCYN